MTIIRFLKLLCYGIRKRLTALKRLYRTRRIFVCLLLMVVVLTMLSLSLPSEKGRRKSKTKKKDESLVFGYNSYGEVLDFDFDFDLELQRGFIEDKEQGCALPLLDPFDKEAMRFEKASPVVSTVCEGEDLVECYLDECFVSHQYRDRLKDWFCMYRDVIHYKKQNLGPRIKLGVHQKYKLVKSDLVEVSCFGTTPLSPGSPPYWSGHKAGLRKVPHPDKFSNSRRFSIMIIAFDSMSKNRFIRKMPRTHNALKKIGAFIFNGYNVVDEGNMGAFFPILVGKTLLEYFENRMDFDEQNLLFSQLSKLGYRTAHFEDSPFLGYFQKKFKVFREQLTDHYVLPLLEEVFGDSTEGNKSFCMGDTPLYRLLLNLTDQFMQLNGHHYSFTFLGDITRDSFTMASAADEDLASFLYNIQKDKKMKETALFLMGDHGLSSSAFRETVQGKLEERLPLMAVMIPERLKQFRPDAIAALQGNVDLLITPFDIHTTLTDILRIKDHRNRYKVPGADLERGLSLLEPIPVNRSCGEAGVQPLWCVCASWHPLSRDDPKYAEISNMLVDYINNLLMQWRHLCRVRTLVSIDYVVSQLPKTKLQEYEKKIHNSHRTYSNYYQAKIVVGPGRAVYEGAIRHIMRSNTFLFADAELNRIYPYADAKESECVKKDYGFLEKFCYCVNYTEPNDIDTNKLRKN